MKREVVEQFDGYQDVIKEIQVSRKYGVNYTSEKDSAEQYINLLHPSRMRLRVGDIIEETPSTKTLRLVSEDGYLPPFQAGQYIALYLDVGAIRTSRPYSISSPPNQIGYFDITVRRMKDGLVSNYLLDEVNRGDTLESSGPAGHFYYNPLYQDRTMVCLAGGSGVTPFMSMIREVVERGLDRTIFLFYGNKDLNEAIFHDALKALSGRFENIHYHPVIENPPMGYEGHVGLMRGELIREVLGGLSGKTFYLCGPQGMYDFCVPELEALGIPRRKIRKEIYGAPPEILDYPGWPSEITSDVVFTISVGQGDAVQARAGQSLLVALEREGVVVPTLCRSGECSICRVKILSGKVFQPAGVPVRKSDRQFGYVHSCVSYPLEDLEILI